MERDNQTKTSADVSERPVAKRPWVRPELRVISKSAIAARFNPGDDGFGFSTGS